MRLDLQFTAVRARIPVYNSYKQSLVRRGQFSVYIYSFPVFPLRYGFYSQTSMSLNLSHFASAWSESFSWVFTRVNTRWEDLASPTFSVSPPHTASQNCFHPDGLHFQFKLSRVLFPPNIKKTGQECVSSWQSWLQRSKSWYDQNGESTCISAVDFLRPVIASVITPECDGIPRLKLDFSKTETWTDFTIAHVYARRVMTVMNYTTFSPEPPTCTLDSMDCRLAWDAVFPTSTSPIRRIPRWFPFVRPGVPVLGCTPPERICKSLGYPLSGIHDDGDSFMNLVDVGNHCNIRIGRLALVYWPTKVLSSDLCANDGLGTYITSNEMENSPRVVTLESLKIERRLQEHFFLDYYTYDNVGRNIFICINASSK
jgi:hypothetical protein